MIEPKYGENIVVLFKHENKYIWYVSDLEFWYIDYEVARYSLDTLYDERKRSSKLTNETLPYFLEDMEAYKCNRNELGEAFAKSYQEDRLNAVYDFKPSLFIDMDEMELYSQYAEYVSFEEYVSEPWKGKYKSFGDKIPEEEKFWLACGSDVYGED